MILFGLAPQVSLLAVQKIPQLKIIIEDFAIIPHQTNQSLGVYDFMLIRYGWAHGELLALEFASKPVF